MYNNKGAARRQVSSAEAFQKQGGIQWVWGDVEMVDGGLFKEAHKFLRESGEK